MAAVIVSAILLYVYPISSTWDRQHQIMFLMTQQTLTRFVDDVCKKGFVSAAMMRNFREQIAEIGLSFDIELKHIKKTWIVANEKKDVEAEMGQYFQIEEEFYTPQINEVLFPSATALHGGPVKAYYFQSGDEFYVTVKSDETEGGQYPVPLVWLPYGGIVKNAAH